MVPLNGKEYANASSPVVQKTLKEILAGIQDNKFNKKPKNNPFHANRLAGKNFGDGVQPDVLISKDAEVAPDGGVVEHNDVIKAVTLDPPVEHHATPEYVLKAFVEPIDYKEWEVLPLPNRSKAGAANLHVKEYPRLQSCSKLQQQFPIDDTPAEEDPFLPWIHDVFPSEDGKYIQFVAQK